MRSGNTIRPLLLTLLAGGCSASSPPPGVVRPRPGEPHLKKLPGPMPHFGPFDSASDALLAACKHILALPNASAGRVDHQDSHTRWRVSSEYCAWVYYTPDRKYELSRLTDQSLADPLHRRRSCVLPSVVEDQRYAPGSIKYIYALHNHPYGQTLSKLDIGFIVEEGASHGFEVQTKDGDLRLSIVAFFSNSFESPTCDGFHQYIPATGVVLKWTAAPGAWRCEQTGRVAWNEDLTDFSVQAMRASCPGQGEP